MPCHVFPPTTFTSTWSAITLWIWLLHLGHCAGIGRSFCRRAYPEWPKCSQLQLFASIAGRHFSTRASILGADASTVASSKPCPSIIMRNSQPSGWLHTSQTAEIAWSPFGLVRRKPWGRRTGWQRQLGAFDIIRAELGICPLRDVSALAGCARLAIHWSSSRLLIRSGSRCSKAHAYALLSTRTREREIYWVGVRLFGQERFLSKAGACGEIWCLDKPALVPERL